MCFNTIILIYDDKRRNDIKSVTLFDIDGEQNLSFLMFNWENTYICIFRMVDVCVRYVKK